MDNKCITEDYTPLIEISTDKQIYNYGDIINVTIKNIYKKDIFYAPNSLYIELKKKGESGVYSSINYYSFFNNKCSNLPPQIPIRPILLKSGEIYSYIIDVVEYCEENQEQGKIIPINLSGEFVIQGRASVDDGGFKTDNIEFFYSDAILITPELEVRIFTDKKSYKQGEEINITVQSPKTIYEAYPDIKIKIREGSDWNSYELNCYNDAICDEQQKLLMVNLVPISPLRIRSFNGQDSFIWKQKYCIYENKTCGEYPYTEGSIKDLTIDKYTKQLKVEFCYWDEKDVDFDSWNVNGNESKKKCVETSFNVNPL